MPRPSATCVSYVGLKLRSVDPTGSPFRERRCIPVCLAAAFSALPAAARTTPGLAGPRAPASWVSRAPLLCRMPGYTPHRTISLQWGAEHLHRCSYWLLCERLATRSRAPNDPRKARHEAGYRSPICLNKRRYTNLAEETHTLCPVGQTSLSPWV